MRMNAQETQERSDEGSFLVNAQKSLVKKWILSEKKWEKQGNKQRKPMKKTMMVLLKMLRRVGFQHLMRLMAGALNEKAKGYASVALFG